MKAILPFVILFSLAGCLKDTTVDKGHRCYDGNKNRVSCEPFMSELREKELTTNVSIQSTYFELADFNLPMNDKNFRCGLSPFSGKRYDYHFNGEHLVVDVDGYTFKFEKSGGANGTLIGGTWVCVNSTDPDVDSAQIEFKDRRTVRIFSLCSK